MTTDKLVWDFDHEKNPTLAKADAITLCDRLIERGLKTSDLKISFSGNKGFSVVVKHGETFTPEKHKAIATGLAGDLETFDTTVYNASRIFRLDYTKHQKTGLYKTPITYGNLKSMSMDKIIELSGQKRTPMVNPHVTKLPESILSIEPQEVSARVVDLDIVADIDFSKKPSILSKAKYVLHQGHIPSGYGNTAFMILAATYKRAGFDAIDTFNMLKGVNDKRAALYGKDKARTDEEINVQVIDVVYSDTWQGGTYSERDNELLEH